jgi:hypothetical protein
MEKGGPSDWRSILRVHGSGFLILQDHTSRERLSKGFSKVVLGLDNVLSHDRQNYLGNKKEIAPQGASLNS